MRIVENLLSYDGELRPEQPSADHVDRRGVAV